MRLWFIFMELKQYFNIVWKRAWIPVVLLIVVAGVSLMTQETPPPVYATSMRFIVGVKPERVPDEFNYDGYYAGVSSEYLTDDFTVVVSSHAFADDVNHHLAEMKSSVNVPSGTIQGVLSAEKQHRILTLNLTWNNPEQLAEIGEAITLALQNDGPKYLAQLTTFGGIITVIDPPSFPVPIPLSLTERLNLPVRLMLALGIGVASTFMLDYLDNRVQGRNELEAMGIAVLAEVRS
jgi:capsular polysaccharide biosynthesis protein